jgi:hypothetical protein
MCTDLSARWRVKLLTSLIGVSKMVGLRLTTDIPMRRAGVRRVAVGPDGPLCLVVQSRNGRTLSRAIRSA